MVWPLRRKIAVITICACSGLSTCTIAAKVITIRFLIRGREFLIGITVTVTVFFFILQNLSYL